MNENLSDYLHRMPIYIFWWLNLAMVHLLVAILHVGVILCDLELLDLRGFTFISMKFRNWMSLNSRVVQMFKSYSFILSFISCFNISEVILRILLISTSYRTVQSTIWTIFSEFKYFRRQKIFEREKYIHIVWGAVP